MENILENNTFVKEFNETHGRAPRAHITTFGCQMNEHDSEILMGLLLQRGYEKSETREASDIEIVNTCSVRENADNRFFGYLGQLKKLKEQKDEFLVCVCGCMMQQQSIIDKLKSSYPWVDVVVGTHNLHRAPQLIDMAYQAKERQMEIISQSEEIVEGLPADRLFKHKALVNIMYGCNNFCTYCIVPYTRGREKSRASYEIIREIRKLANDGVKEVMLLGQNVNSYKGIDSNGKPITFAQLINEIAKIDGISRIRFMTSHPKDISQELIDTFKTCSKLCKYIHLPVQSGSNRVLKKMNRRYTREDYLEKIRKLKEAVPDITISTDIIVGFPGETEEDFQDTLDLIQEVEYDSAFTFLYSIRKGTPAEKFEEQIPETVKHERFERLVKLVNEISEKKNKTYVGKTLKVLFDSKSKKKSTSYSGRTDGFKLVNVESGRNLSGIEAEVIITEGKTFSLEGKLV